MVWPEAPLFSIVTPVYDPPVDVLRATLASVQRQTYGNWEWILVDDCSPDPAVRHTLREAAEFDLRLVVVERATNGHIVAASNDGLARARGEFVVLVDHDDLLVQHALARVATVLAAHDDVDYLYTDEQKQDEDRRLFDRFDKPDWSPERLLSQMYCNHLSVLRRSVVEQVGGFREGFDGAQDHDLVLRVTEVARRVEHVPEILYHWRAVEGSAAAATTAKPYAYTSGLRALTEAVQRRGLRATVEPIGHLPGNYRVSRSLAPERTVSLVVPTRGERGLLWGVEQTHAVELVRAALEHTQHEALEVVLVLDADTAAEVRRDVVGRVRRLVGADRLTVTSVARRPDGRVNLAEAVNRGVLAAGGERLVLLHDDVLPHSPRWLERLVGPLDEPGVAVTGAKLLHADGTLQHAGVATWFGGYVHPYAGDPADAPGPMADLAINREATAVTGACLATRRDVFEAVGGFSEVFPQHYGDLDYCAKVRAAGGRVLFVAEVSAHHLSARDRPRPQRWEDDLLAERWGRPGRDRYLPEGGR